MGMFDWVMLPFKCPVCKFDQTIPSEFEEGIWQTKSTICSLDIYKKGSEVRFEEGTKMIEGEIEIHNLCPNCEKFTRAIVKIENGKLTDKIRYLRAEEAEKIPL